MSLLLKNARIVGSHAEPTDILLKHGIITAIGGRPVGTAELDLAGRFVMPGLWDSHAHLTQVALNHRRIDVSAAASAASAATLMASSPRPDGDLPLIGFGFRDGLWPDAPTRELLDGAVPDVPAVLISGDLHCCWLNTAALERFGLASHPTGLLREDEAFPVTAELGSAPREVIDGWVAEVAAAAARRGLVGAVDFEMADNITDWERRFAGGFRGLRIDAGVYESWLDAAIDRGLSTGLVLADTDSRLRVGPFKVITDGSLNTRTAYCVDPYPGLDGADARGQLTVSPERLIALLRRVAAAGLEPAVHAIGDAANAAALDAFETAGCRGRIEHAQLVRESDFDRFAALGVTASVQPEHAMDDRSVADLYWEGRTDRSFALRRLLDSGATLLLGSDAPVAPLDPWVTIAAAHERSRDGLEPWHPEQSISVREAITASTRSVVGVGEVADLVILESDPLQASAAELRSMAVAGTMVGGYFTHDAL